MEQTIDAQAFEVFAWGHGYVGARATLREAMRAFETQGIIRRKQGSGTYVNQPPRVLDSGLEVLESMLTLARRMNMDVGPGEVFIDRVPAEGECAEALGVAEGTGLVRVSRTMRADSAGMNSCTSPV